MSRHTAGALRVSGKGRTCSCFCSRLIVVTVPAGVFGSLGHGTRPHCTVLEGHKSARKWPVMALSARCFRRARTHTRVCGAGRLSRRGERRAPRSPPPQHGTGRRGKIDSCENISYNGEISVKRGHYRLKRLICGEPVAPGVIAPRIQAPAGQHARPASAESPESWRGAQPILPPKAPP